MDPAFESKLSEALEALFEGQTPEEILPRYQSDSLGLRPFLETAAQLSDAAPAHSSVAQKASREAFLAHARELRAEKVAAASRPLWRRFFFSFAAFTLILLLSGFLVLFQAQQAIPGDPLYGLKRTTEDARLYLAPEGREEELQRLYERERNREVYRMLDRGRDGVAGYRGTIKALSAEQWEVGNLTILITADTVIRGDPQVGAFIEAHCLIRDGQVIAETLTVLDPSGPDS